MSTSTLTTERAITVGKISADAHVNEPRTLWADNLPVRMRDHAIRGIAAGDDGGWSLILDGRHVAKAGEDEAHRLKMLDPAHRLEIMRHEGVVGECMFPTIGLYVWMLDDQAGCESSCRVYNEFISDGLGRSERFKCAGLVPGWTIEGALAEIEFIAGRASAHSCCRRCRARVRRWNHPQWEPVWWAIEEVGLPVVMHQGTGHSPNYRRGAGAAVAAAGDPERRSTHRGAAHDLGCAGEPPRAARGVRRVQRSVVGMDDANDRLLHDLVRSLRQHHAQRQALDQPDAARAAESLRAPTSARHLPGRSDRPPQHRVHGQRRRAVGQRLSARRRHVSPLPRHRRAAAHEVDANTARRVFDNAVRVFGFDEEPIDQPLEDVTTSSS